MKHRLPPSDVRSTRLVIRVWQRHDADRLAEAIDRSREHLQPWMPWARRPSTAADIAELIASWNADWQRGGDVAYGLFVGDTIVGSCGLHRRGRPGTIDIGYWVHVDHIGQGYASEAGVALTDLACDLSGIHTVRIEHDQANTRSGAVPRRLAFSLVAVGTRPAEAPGEVGIRRTWAMATDRWRAIRSDSSDRGGSA